MLHNPEKKLHESHILKIIRIWVIIILFFEQNARQHRDTLKHWTLKERWEYRGNILHTIILRIQQKLHVSIMELFIRLYYLQQSFFLTKMALKIFQKNCPIDFSIIFIYFQQPSLPEVAGQKILPAGFRFLLA